MTIVENRCELWLDTGDFDPLTLTGETSVGTARFTIEALAEDATLDNPIPVDVAVQRWMADGAVASTQGHENREPYFKVAVSADTSTDLAAAEKELALRAGQSGTLTWIPMEGSPDAPASVFEVWTWHLEHGFDDIDELELTRVYGIRLTAKPWVRSKDLTLVSPLPWPSPSTASIDNCSALTFWTGAPNAPTIPLSAPGTVRETVVVAGSTKRQSMSLTLNKAVTGLAATPYIRVIAAIGGGSGSFQVSADGIPLTLAGAVGTMTYWQVPATMTACSKIVVSASVLPSGGATGFSVTLSVDDVSRVNTVGGIGTHKQLSRTIASGGSVATTGSIHVASSDGVIGLGVTSVYTCTDRGNGYTPALRGYRTAGGTIVPDTAAVSGARDPLTSIGSSLGPVSYAIAAGQLQEASYAVVARMKTDTTGVTITTTTSVGVGSYTPQQLVTPVTWPGSGLWLWVALGIVSLPTQQVPSGSTLNHTVQFSATGGNGHQWLDELYLFDVTHGGLSMVDTTVGGALPHLWLDAPDVDQIRNRPAVYVGTAAAKSDAVRPYPANIMSLGQHTFDPAGTVLVAVTDAADDSVVSVSFYDRWHSNAGH